MQNLLRIREYHTSPKVGLIVARLSQNVPITCNTHPWIALLAFYRTCVKPPIAESCNMGIDVSLGTNGMNAQSKGKSMFSQRIGRITVSRS